MLKKFVIVAMTVIAACMIMSCRQPIDNGIPQSPENLPALTDFRGIPSKYFYPDYNEWGEPNFHRGTINLNTVKGTGLRDDIPNAAYVYETPNQIMVLQRHEVNYSETYEKYMTYGYLLLTFMKNDAYENMNDLVFNSVPILAYYLVPSRQGEFSYITKDGEFGGSCIYNSSLNRYSFSYESLRRGISKIEQIYKVEFKEDGYTYEDITDTPEGIPYLGWIIPGHNSMENFETSTISFRIDSDNIYLLPNVYSKYSTEALYNAKSDSPVGEQFDKSKHGLMSEIGERVSVIAANTWALSDIIGLNFPEVSTFLGANSNILLE